MSGRRRGVSPRRSAYDPQVPYELRGNKVCKVDGGVVKDHGSDHAAAVKHLRALKANVEEGSPVLGALLEGVENELRDASGRWMRGATSERHGAFKIGDHVTFESGSREAGGHGPVTFTKQPGVHEVVGFQRNGNLRLREPKHGTTFDVHHSHAQLAPNPRSSSSRERGLASIEAGRRSDRPRIRPEDRAAFEARGRSGRPAKKSGPLDEVVNFGGIPTKKGDVIAQLQREGHPQAYIDRYLQGLDRGRKVRESAPAPAVLGALLEGR